jgi:putative SOS response-associated peptidase YedK
MIQGRIEWRPQILRYFGPSSRARDVRTKVTLMCGRATLTCPVEDIAEAFGVSPIPLWPPRFNIAPGQDVAIIRRDVESELAIVRWGLVPWWSKDGKANRTIQARVETVATAPAFRDAFRSRRCLVVVDGFYEWSASPKGKAPHHIRFPDRRPFAIAGVWDSWKNPEGQRIETCAVVTTASQGSLRELHDRMPLVLEGEDRERWLTAPPEEARAVGATAGGRAELQAVPVSTWVNDVRHDDARCLEAPVDAPVALPAQTTLRFG